MRWNPTPGQGSGFIGFFFPFPTPSLPTSYFCLPSSLPSLFLLIISSSFFRWFSLFLHFFFLFSILFSFVWSLCDLFVFISLLFLFLVLCLYLWSFCSSFASFFFSFSFLLFCFCVYVLSCVCGSCERGGQEQQKKRREMKRKSNWKTC
jgi:hypothetical protein